MVLVWNCLSGPQSSVHTKERLLWSFSVNFCTLQITVSIMLLRLLSMVKTVCEWSTRPVWTLGKSRYFTEDRYSSVSSYSKPNLPISSEHSFYFPFSCVCEYFHVCVHMCGQGKYAYVCTRVWSLMLEIISGLSKPWAHQSG